MELAEIHAKNAAAPAPFKDKVVLEFSVNGKKCTYDSETGILDSQHQDVKMTSRIPKNWGTMRVIQFAESLLKAALV